MNNLGPALIGTEMPKWRQHLNRFWLEVWHWRVKRWIPHLVWIGDEVDVGVTFKDIGALGGNLGRVFEAQQLFHDMGIEFDTGSGCHGRDWEWDYCLSGPISVTFKRRAKNPQKRTLKKPPDLKLVS